MGKERAGSTKLVCFPYAGGNAHVFRVLASLLGDLVDVYGVQLPGRGSRLSEEPISTAGEIIAHLDSELSFLTVGDYAVLGTSMGALLAFEWIRSLRRRGGALPRCLFALGARPPQLRNAGRGISRLPRDEFEQALRRYGGTPEAILAEPDLMDLMIPMLRADFGVVESYVYLDEQPLGLPIVVMGGTDDDLVKIDTLSGWSSHTTGAYRELHFAGDHFFYRQSEVLSAVAEVISETLPARGRTGR